MTKQEFLALAEQKANLVDLALHTGQAAREKIGQAMDAVRSDLAPFTDAQFDAIKDKILPLLQAFKYDAGRVI